MVGGGGNVPRESAAGLMAAISWYRCCHMRRDRVLKPNRPLECVRAAPPFPSCSQVSRKLVTVPRLSDRLCAVTFPLLSGTCSNFLPFREIGHRGSCLLAGYGYVRRLFRKSRKAIVLVCGGVVWCSKCRDCARIESRGTSTSVCGSKTPVDLSVTDSVTTESGTTESVTTDSETTELVTTEKVSNNQIRQ